MTQIAIQIRTTDTLSTKLPGAKTIAFVPLNDIPGVSEAVINEAQFELIAEDLAKLPHKLDTKHLGARFKHSTARIGEIGKERTIMNQNQQDLLIATLRFKPAAAPMTAEVSVTAEAREFLAAAGTGHAVWTSIPLAPIGDLLKRLGE